MAVELTHKQALNREKDIQDELERLKAKKDKTPEDHAAVPTLLDEFRQVHAHRLDLEHDMALSEIRSATKVETADTADTGAQVVDAKRSGPEFIAGKYRNPWDLSEVRYAGNREAELRGRALSAVEQMPFATDKVREAATKFVERDGRDGKATELVLNTTSPLYSEAFTKVIRSNGQMAALNAEEQREITRAMSLTDTAGGFLVPFQLDPTVILTANGSVNQIRQISRVVTATGDVWNGISSAGVTGSWDGEAVEVSDDAPTLGQPSVPVYKFQVYVPVSHEIAMDAPGLANDIAQFIAFEKDAKEGIAFATGSGSGQPTGIVTALVASSPTVVVNSATTDTFALADVYALDSALPARYAANASWLAHRGTYNAMRRFDTNGGAALWGFLADGRKPELLGRPDYVSEAMDGVVNASQENYLLAFGDFQNYVIADRLGVTMSYIPHTFGANGRPTGQAGWHAWMRVGADSVNDAAFRLLNVT
ncbi:phage major capsid protein [Mycobacterium dioxanotrophicus]|uniref:Phage major capsid protein n=1 Tax=Mycobacterium dioxanotrophicus TaxID=482462 RepID=A0A1Y0C1Y1_9MYCO|nr:phage major capsid protein [Mycobacterium dioxanotrophicus]ART69115.1 phage major capsid protein [Mycobacterium dioxanotrophicus]